MKFCKMARGMSTLLQNYEPIDGNKFIMKNFQNPLMVETKISLPPSSPILVNQQNNSDENIYGDVFFNHIWLRT